MSIPTSSQASAAILPNIAKAVPWSAKTSSCHMVSDMTEFCSAHELTLNSEMTFGRVVPGFSSDAIRLDQSRSTKRAVASNARINKLKLVNDAKMSWRRERIEAREKAKRVESDVDEDGEVTLVDHPRSETVDGKIGTAGSTNNGDTKSPLPSSTVDGALKTGVGIGNEINGVSGRQVAVA